MHSDGLEVGMAEMAGSMVTELPLHRRTKLASRQSEMKKTPPPNHTGTRHPM